MDLLGEWRTPGYLMIIGGADRLDPESRLQKLFLRLVNRVQENSGQRGIVLISTATRHPEILTSEYIRIFGRLGVHENVYAPLIRSREEAHNPDVAGLIAQAAGIFLTGGDQYTLTQTLDKTPVEEAVMSAFGNGAVIAGTSAG